MSEAESFIFTTIKSLLREPREITASSNMRDFTLDSLDYSDLAIAIEDRLGWSVDDDKLWQYETVGDLVKAVNSEDARSSRK
ncbi:acyl carrier protein [Mesorhizobium sp.]|uniref:acyl carrier protein n=1 Tax=Mesorhizobium sp. TaxID=1871066 RepID=UPI0025B8671C|nr:acyl carrier protein [Mesorhizobium sp.]